MKCEACKLSFETVRKQNGGDKHGGMCHVMRWCAKIVRTARNPPN